MCCIFRHIWQCSYDYIKYNATATRGKQVARPCVILSIQIKKISNGGPIRHGQALLFLSMKKKVFNALACCFYAFSNIA